MTSSKTLNPDAWQYAAAWSSTLWSSLQPETMGHAVREQRLAALIARATAASPFYRRRAATARQLSDFAPTTKRELMDCFDEWATDRQITRKAAESFIADPARAARPWMGKYLIWSSSGTSGEPGLFVQDAASLAAYDAIDALRLRGRNPLANLNSLWGFTQRFAFVGATGGHFAGVVSIERMRRTVPGAVIEVVSALEPVGCMADRLAALDPTVLICYPSAAAALAERQLCGKLKLRLTEIWLGGEQFTSTQRRMIGAAFGCAIRNNYGASEFFSIASECRLGKLHVNADWVILEPVDRHMRPILDDSFSDSVLLTNLANAVQPLLRYQLTDRIRFLPQPCACGDRFSAIEVDGRADDTLHFRSHEGAPIPVLPLALETVIEEGAGITNFQLVCSGGKTIEVRFGDEQLDAAGAFQRLRSALLDYLKVHRAVGVRVHFSQQPPRRQSRSGKLRRIVEA